MKIRKLIAFITLLAVAAIPGRIAMADEQAVTLDVEWTAAADRLTADYTVRNHGSLPIAVFDRPYTMGKDRIVHIDYGDAPWLTAAAYGVLRVDRLVPVMPADRRFEVPVVPYARAVPPGGALRGRIVIALPPVINDPYPDPQIKDPAPLPVHQAVLRVGYGVMTAGTVPLRVVPDSAGELLSFSHAWTNLNQVVLTAPAFAIDETAATYPRP